MKRIYLFALLVFTALGLSVTAAQAQQVLDHGCSSQMWGYMTDQADAMRARNKAYEREILNRQPSTLYLTCFDQALVLSSRLGYIFSDVVMPNPPPADTVAFDDGPNGTIPPGADLGGATFGTQNTVAYAGWGARESLALDLYNVVTPEFDNWLDAPATTPGPAQFNFLPQWSAANDQMKPLAAALSAIMAQIENFQGIGTGQGYRDSGSGGAPFVIKIPPPGPGILNADEEGYIKLVKDIDTFVKGFPTITLTGLPAALTEYTTLTGDLDTMVTAIKADRNNILGGTNGFLAQLQNDVMNLNGMTCARMDNLWDKLDTSFYNALPAGMDGAFYPPEGKYYAFSPFYTLKDLLTPPNPPSPPAMTDFVNELSNFTDNAALNAVWTDITTGDLAAATPNNPLWPAPPVFQPTDTEATIIQRM